MVQELLDVGVDMSDAEYYLVSLTNGSIDGGENIQVALKSELPYLRDSDGNITKDSNGKECINASLANWCLPTYTVSQLHFKLHEWIYPTIEGKQYSGGLSYFKDAPFYIFYYDLKHKVLDEKGNVIKIIKKDNYISAEGGTPIESLAYLLKQCHLKDVGYKTESGKPFPDTGNIRSKYDDFIWNLK
jgi:hypothetical protein